MSETAESAPQHATAESPTAAGATWLARIHVTLKPVVLDPQGDAVLHGLRHLGFSGVSSVRVGKYLEVVLAAADQRAAEAAIRQMCDRLLANPVIESYAYDVEQHPAVSAVKGG